MRERENQNESEKDSSNSSIDGNDSVRVRRLEQQIVDMAAEIAKLGELSSSSCIDLSFSLGDEPCCNLWIVCVLSIDSIAAKGDYNAKRTKVMHLKNNPVQKAQHLTMLEEARQQLLRENDGAIGASAEQVEELKKQLAASEKRHARLKEVFHEQVDVFREACLHLLGWEISMKLDSKGNQTYKLTSLYAQAQEDFLMFRKPFGAKVGDLDLVETDYANTLRKEIEELQLHQQQSSNPPIPNFLSQVTHELFHAKTMWTVYR
jgi:hypothetical protein